MAMKDRRVGTRARRLLFRGRQTYLPLPASCQLKVMVVEFNSASPAQGAELAWAHGIQNLYEGTRVWHLESGHQYWNLGHMARR